MNENVPLSIMLENTKVMMMDAFNQVQEKTNLPAYLMEGIILDLLASVRNQKNVELVSDMNRMKQEQKEQERKKGKE
jgi:hypothetical protein